LQSHSNQTEIHLKGEREIQSPAEPMSEPIGIDTFGGRVQIQWDPQAPARCFRNQLLLIDLQLLLAKALAANFDLTGSSRQIWL
jgi:hypothetical protein